MCFIQSSLLRIANNTLIVVLPQDRLPNQYNNLSQGLNISPAYYTSLMNDLLHELPPDIREYIDCIMDDVIIFTPDVKSHKKVLKSVMLMLKKYGMLLTINRVHTFRSKVKHMGLLLSSKDNLLTIIPLGSLVKAIFNPTNTSDSEGY